MSQDEAGPVRLVLTLAIAGLISGVVIVGIYLLTLPRIRRNQAQALLSAVDDVLALGSGSTKKAFVVKEGKLVEFERPLLEGLPKEAAVYAAYCADGELVGYAIPGATAGFQDTVALLYGFDPKTKQVTGMKVLESKETPGLGDKILKDQAFLAQFRGLSFASPLVGVKPGTRSKRSEVDVISGATISSKAVLKAMNQAHLLWEPLLLGAGGKP
jgi:electron transport complex protein RnfG